MTSTFYVDVLQVATVYLYAVIIDIIKSNRVNILQKRVVQYI